MMMKSLSLPENRDSYIRLVDAYSEKHRQYHNVSHLCSVLERLDEVEHLTENKYEIALALWFHDAVYKPFSKSNESDSADWARKFLAENDMTVQAQERVRQLVMATSHSSVPKSDDEKLIVDIDLSILGRAEDHYVQFEAGVRCEYRKVPSCIYARSRKAVLREFLQRDRIYSSEPFYEALERQARKNLQGELSRLQGGEI
jgi:predicted metal-dependent HD superfamily phosphohydrolase